MRRTSLARTANRASCFLKQVFELLQLSWRSKQRRRSNTVGLQRRCKVFGCNSSLCDGYAWPCIIFYFVGHRLLCQHSYIFHQSGFFFIDSRLLQCTRINLLTYTVCVWKRIHGYISTFMAATVSANVVPSVSSSSSSSSAYSSSTTGWLSSSSPSLKLGLSSSSISTRDALANAAVSGFCAIGPNWLLPD